MKKILLSSVAFAALAIAPAMAADMPVKGYGPVYAQSITGPAPILASMLVADGSRMKAAIAMAA